MDLIILLALIVIIAFFFRDYKNVVYFLGIIEIFFRLVHRIAELINLAGFQSFVNEYIPSSGNHQEN